MALRDLRFAKGRFALMGSVVLLITLLVTMLSGLTAGLARDSGSAIEGLPADAVAFGTSASADGKPSFSDSRIDQKTLQGWQDVPGVTAEPLGISMGRLSYGPGGERGAPAAFFGVAPGGKAGGGAPAAGTVVLSKGLATDTGLAAGTKLQVAGHSLTVAKIGGDASYSHTSVAWLSLADWRTLTPQTERTPDPDTGTAAHPQGSPAAGSQEGRGAHSQGGTAAHLQGGGAPGSQGGGAVYPQGGAAAGSQDGGGAHSQGGTAAHLRGGGAVRLHGGAAVNAQGGAAVGSQGGGEVATVLLLRAHGDADLSGADARLGTTTVALGDAKSAIPSFSAENGSLQLMRAFLFGISALVIGAFFTVWTIQRRGDVAVLKALGASTGYLLRDALAQAVLVLLTGAGLGGAIGGLAGAAVAGSVPFVVSTATTLVPVAVMIVLGAAGAALAIRKITSVDPLTALGAAR